MYRKSHGIGVSTLHHTPGFTLQTYHPKQRYLLIYVCMCVAFVSSVLRLTISLFLDPLEELNESQAQTATNSAAELLKQGAGIRINSDFVRLACKCIRKSIM